MVEQPAKGRTLLFRFIAVPPHADAVLQLTVDGHALPGLVWASDTWWSADGRWLALQSCPDTGWHREWRMVDLDHWRWVALDLSAVSGLEDAWVQGKTVGGACISKRILDLPGWMDLPHRDRLETFDPAAAALRPR